MRHLTWLVLMPVLLALTIGCKSDDLIRPKGGKGDAANDPAMADPMAGMDPALAPGGEPQPGQPQGNGKERVFGPAAVKKNPKTLLGNLRAAGDRAAIRNEMSQIKTLFTAYTLEPGNSRTLNGFLEYIKTEARVIHKAINDKYYTINMQAKGGEDIIAYETEQWTQGYYCVRMNGAMGFLSEAEWKKGLGKP